MKSVARPAQRRFAERQSAQGSLSVQPRADEQHDGDARHGRRAGDGGACRRAASRKRILPNIIRAARLAARCCCASATSCAPANGTPLPAKPCTVKEALLVMTRAKSGSLAVVNARGQTGRRFHRRRFPPAHVGRRQTPVPAAEKRDDAQARSASATTRWRSRR